VRTLVDGGIKAGVGMAPLLPGLSDKPELMADVVRAARDAGATHLWANVLYLRPGTREHFLANLAREWPELLPAYERLYAGRAYLPDAFLKPRRDRVRELARRLEIADRRVVKLAPVVRLAVGSLPAGSHPRELEPADPHAEQLTLVLAAEVESRAAA
jgi:DNA repair photolyase